MTLAPAAFDELFSDVGAEIDAVVQGQAPFESDNAQGETTRPDIDVSLVDEISGVEGVEAAEPVVFTLAWVLDEDGDSVTAVGIVFRDGDVPTHRALGLCEYATTRLRHWISRDEED